MLRVAIFGASGRMGRTLLQQIDASDDLTLAGAATEPNDPRLGEDAGTLSGLPSLRIALTDDPSAAVADCDVAIDFTLPAATAGNVDACLAAKVPMVIGTTGLDEVGEAALTAAAKKIPLVYGRNMSVGVNLVTELVRVAADKLGTDYDIEITDVHHRDKVDAPSGTALQLGEAAATGRGVALGDVAVYARHGRTGARDAGAIGFVALRAGGVVGDHDVLFASSEEIVTLGHRATDRAVFARGALRAARWVAEQPPGRYSMRDVLGFAA